MAEALLAAMDPEHFEAFSAGIERGEMHPFAVEVMKEIDINLQGRPTRSVDDVRHLPFDVVITLCDRARFLGPKFTQAEILHWRLDDPLIVSDRVKQKRMFHVLRDQISQRIRFFTLVYARSAA
jgi:ArsR family transcriptional regulator